MSLDYAMLTNLRLEQERIGYSWLKAALSAFEPIE
jgi:hypothetical protein